MRVSEPAFRSAPFLIALLVLHSSCRAPAAHDPLGGVIQSLPPGETVLYARTLGAEIEEAPSDGIVAVVRDPSGHLVLRVYRWDGHAARLVHDVPGGETFQNLDLLDADADGRRDLIVIWGGGQLSQIEIIARGEDDRYRPLFQEAGSEIEIRRTPDGRLELLVTGRTYEEEAGQPPVYESIPYRWDGERFAPALPVNPR